MAALVENKKGIVDANVTQEQRESMEARNAAFQKEIKMCIRDRGSGENCPE